MIEASGDLTPELSGPMPQPSDPSGYTGRCLVVLDADVGTGRRRRPSVASEMAGVLADSAGLHIALSDDYLEDDQGRAEADQAGGLMLAELGIAVADADPDQTEVLRSLVADSSSPVQYVEAERWAYPTNDFLIGFQKGVNATVEAVQASGGLAPPSMGARATWTDDAISTWGLKATRAIASRVTGRGCRVAVLDTGVDLGHPDLAPNIAASQSFVPNESVQDGHGHGTHCAGTVASIAEPAGGVRYGVAPEAELHIGKVLSNQGSGRDGWILAGIEWAVRNNCQIISMSLGSPTSPSDPHSVAYERAATRALQRGTAIVAAAGNSSDRRAGRVAPVGRPANSPSILAVGALDGSEAVANFSCGTVPPGDGVDIAGPGVAVLSSWPGGGTRQLSGTSMATPHVAGIAALVHDEGVESIAELVMRLLLSGRRLPLPSGDVGVGMTTIR